MEDKEQTLYEILNVPQNATLKEIKIAYRRRAMEYHPDTNPNANNEFGHKMMCKINEAYSILRNPDLRILYDETLYEKEKSNISSENSTPTTTSQKKSGNEAQTKTYKRTYKPNSEQYNYYNEMDFDEYMQEEFIEWLKTFSYEYIKLAFDFYVNINKSSDFVLEKIYVSFNNIIDYEKKLTNKKENHIVYNI